MYFAPQRRALFRHLNLQNWSDPLAFLTFWLRNVLRATTACTFSTAQLPKLVRPWCVLYILTWKCASRHNGVHFLDSSTSKSGPTLMCFVHFHFEMCFAPQRRALFRHLNFQKWCEHGVLCTFWLGNVLSATTAWNFSSLIWPAGSAPAALASLLFDPQEPQIIGKTQCFATFLPFRASASSFFWLFLFLLLFLLIFLFSLPLPSKLPSIIYRWMIFQMIIHIYIYIKSIGVICTLRFFRWTPGQFVRPTKIVPQRRLIIVGFTKRMLSHSPASPLQLHDILLDRYIFLFNIYIYIETYEPSLTI